jgi:thiosulfate/3-mercaptopyruvate sulfurtransferase
MLKIHTPIVSVDWLLQNLGQPNLVILDATMKKITLDKNEFENPNKYIPNARFFDIKNTFSDTSSSFPNTMLSADKFQEKAQLLGINKESAIVVYDTIGIYTSPRVWWMFKSMGHDNIAVLDGGFPEWISNDFPTETEAKFQGSRGDFKTNYNLDYFSNKVDVLHAISDKSNVIIDARSEDRFLGMKPEPREGLRSGHIPTSLNLHYNDLLVDGKLKEREYLQTKFQEILAKEDKIIFSCGSGVTACIVALGAELSGYKKGSVYDGSWTEWGSLHELPIEN